MSRKFIWLYTFYVGWSIILLSRMKLEKWDHMKSILVLMPLCITFFVFYRKREMAKDQKTKISSAAISIILLLVYYFLKRIGNGKFQVSLALLVLMGMGIMTIMMLGALSYYSKAEIEWCGGIGVLLQVITIFCLLKFMYLFLKSGMTYLFDGMVIFVIIIIYFRCFLFKNENEESVGENHIEVINKKRKTSKKLYINIGILIFLLLSGYLFFLGELMDAGKDKGILAEFVFLLVTISGMVLTWVSLKIHQFLMFLMLGSIAMIMIFSFISILQTNDVKWMLMLAVQAIYILLISILGGLILRVAYLYAKTYEDLMYLILGTGFPLWMGNLFVNDVLKKEIAGLVGLIFFPLIGIVFYIFRRGKIITKEVKGKVTKNNVKRKEERR